MARYKQLLAAGLVLTSAAWIVGQSSLNAYPVIEPVRPARVAAPKIATPRVDEKGEHWIFVLTNAADGLYIGTRKSLTGAPRSFFDGGGTGCETVKFRALAGPFASSAQAYEALEQGLSEKREFPINVGLMGRWRADGKWYGLWSPTVVSALDRPTVTVCVR